jgi:hypothetical protein
MAYVTAELEIKALKVIKENDLVFIHEVSSFMNLSRQTFYDHGLDKLDSLKEALEFNKNKLKSGLRKKWYVSDNATVQIALYKLIGTDNEADAINSQKVKHEGELKTGFTVNIIDSGKEIATSESDIEG